MGMTGDHGREPSGLGVEVEIGQVVEDVELPRSHGNDIDKRERCRPRATVDIASNGRRGRDRAELFEYFSSADVAGMNDEV